MSTQAVIRLKAKPGGTASPPPPLAGLKFAIYARKSNEDDRNEDNRSTGRQVEQARRYVETRGGGVLVDQVYVDEEVSGAEFKARAGLLRFLDALKNGRPFSALVMMDESRLGREQIETQYTLKQITDTGTRVFYYQTGEEAKLDTSLDKIMSALKMFGNEQEREKTRQRCRDAAERKARQGHVAGGRCFGYANVRMRGDRPAEPGESYDYIVRRVNPEEAAVVVGIFRAFAAGWGMVKIAKALSLAPGYADLSREYFGGQKVLPPRERTVGWDPMTVRQVLHRRLYRGEVVWGKTTRTDRDGRAGVVLKRDPSEWLRREEKHLRILEEGLWAAVQKRLKAQQDTYLRDTRGKLWGKPDLRREGQYLLSGLAQCQTCGASLTVLGGTPRVYGCRHHEERGTCTNTLTQPVTLVDAAFLSALQREALTAERFRVAVEAGVQRVREALAKEPDTIAILTREKATLQRRIAKLVEAIVDGGGPKAVVQEIEKAEARVMEIDAEIGRFQAGPALRDLNLQRIEKDVTGQLQRFADLLKGNVPRARQLLKKLLVDRMAFTPADDRNGKRTYAFTGELSYGAVLREVISLGNISPGESGDRRAATGNPLASGAKTPNNP